MVFNEKTCPNVTLISPHYTKKSITHSTSHNNGNEMQQNIEIVSWINLRKSVTLNNTLMEGLERRETETPRVWGLGNSPKRERNSERERVRSDSETL